MWLARSIADQWAHLPVLLGPGDAAGKTYIVTGANVGIGLETAKHLVRASSSCVILAVRNIEAGEQARAEIERATGRSGVAHVWHLDLSSYESIKTFAAKANSELDRLDSLVGNAAVSLDQFTLSEGVETCVKVNLLGTFLLAALLFSKLRETGKRHKVTPRLIFVMSALGFAAKDDLHKLKDEGILSGLNDPKKSKMTTRYAATKLAEVYAVRQFATAYPREETGVIINMVDPGLCKTSLARDTSSANRALLSAMRTVMARTPEEGSRTILHAIVSEDHGKFLTGGKVKDDWIQPWMTNESGRKMQAKLWTEIVTTLNEVAPGCLSIKFSEE